MNTARKENSKDLTTLFDGYSLIRRDKTSLAGKTIYISTGKITYPKDYPNSPAVFYNLRSKIKMIIPEFNWNSLIK